MPMYFVTWTIDIEAENPIEAAKAALQIQRDRKSIATVFTVRRKLGERRSKGDVIDLTKRRDGLWERLAELHDEESGADDSSFLAWISSIATDPDHQGHAHAVEFMQLNSG